MKYQMRMLAMGCVIVAATASFAAQKQNAAVQPKEADMTVFGIRLGEKFTVPECKRTVRNKYVPTPPYDIMQVSSLCFAWTVYGLNDPPELNTPVVTDKVKMFFPFSGTPEGLLTGAEASHDNLGGPIEAQIVDGNIEIITLYTEGLQFQDLVLAMLKEKYGEPATFEDKSKQNGFGAVFASHSAAWQFTNLGVLFEGTMDRTNVGYIVISTNKGAEYILKNAKQKTQVGPKL